LTFNLYSVYKAIEYSAHAQVGTIWATFWSLTDVVMKDCLCMKKLQHEDSSPLEK